MSIIWVYYRYVLDNKKFWRETLHPYVEKSSAIALRQLFVSISLFVLVWYAYIKTIHYSVLLVIPFTFVMSFVVLRFFVLMHDCGHASLFDSPKMNKVAGYILGVLNGMPQYVWSKHHAYHHMTNGDWEKYQGPMSIITTTKYEELSEKKKVWYSRFRHPAFSPIAGFYYILFNPRFTWIMGTINLFFRASKSIFTPGTNPVEVLTECKSKYWKTPKEFRHMAYNNIGLITIWVLMSNAIGASTFFLFYIPTEAIAGALGITFFTVQHNFENSYAADTAHVDYFQAALEGTSYLKLPALVNWFTADIAYHHIHHLSTSVPNYQLARCHQELRDNFKQVKRVKLGEILKSLTYTLWDQEKQMIISVAEYKNNK